MNEAAAGATPSGPAWQPFTFGGLAVIARSRLGCVLLAQLGAGIFICGCILYFLQRSYVPVISQAIQEMPAGAKISDGRLAGIDTTVIAESKFLAVAVTPEKSIQIGQTADIQIQLRPANFRIGTVFRPDWGWEFGYDTDWSVDLSRSFLDPWWGAWRPVVLTAVGLLALIQLFINWAILAFLYIFPAKLMAWFGERQLSWGGAWRLSLGALIPGALLMAVGILLYTWKAMDSIGLGLFYVAHLLTGLVYLVGGTLSCPRNQSITDGQNPFVS